MFDNEILSILNSKKAVKCDKFLNKKLTVRKFEFLKKSFNETEVEVLKNKNILKDNCKLFSIYFDEKFNIKKVINYNL